MSPIFKGSFSKNSLRKGITSWLYNEVYNYAFIFFSCSIYGLSSSELFHLEVHRVPGQSDFGTYNQEITSNFNPNEQRFFTEILI